MRSLSAASAPGPCAAAAAAARGGDACASCDRYECRVGAPTTVPRAALPRCPGSARLRPATAADLAAAKRVLAAMDFVVVLERFDAAAKRRLLDALGLAAVPLDAVRAYDGTGGHNALRSPRSRVNHDAATLTAEARAPPRDAYPAILADQWWDLELYCWADARARGADARGCAAALNATHGAAARAAAARATDRDACAAGPDPGRACCTHAADKLAKGLAPGACHTGGAWTRPGP